jgi:hypothetical protein
MTGACRACAALGWPPCYGGGCPLADAIEVA